MMQFKITTILIATLLLAACTPQTPPLGLPKVETSPQKPSSDRAGCWQEHRRPAIYESVTEHIRLPATSPDAPATFRTEKHHRQVRPRETIWLRVVCPDQGAGQPIFTASLQRALKARGLYQAEITGQMDSATEAALAKFQRGMGLESRQLSHGAARALGLVPFNE